MASATATASSDLVEIRLFPKLGESTGVLVRVPSKIAKLLTTPVPLVNGEGDPLVDADENQICKSPATLTDLEYAWLLSDLNKRSILTTIFGCDEEGNTYITQEELDLLKVLHGFNYSTFKFDKKLPLWKRVFIGPKPDNLPVHILVSERILKGELGPQISIDNPCGVHFIRLLEIGASVLRTEPAVVSAFRTITTSTHRDEKKMNRDGPHGVHEEIAVEVIQRALEYTFEDEASYNLTKSDLPRHRTRTEDTKIVAIFDVNDPNGLRGGPKNPIGSSDIYFRSVLCGVLGLVPTSEILLRTCLEYVHTFYQIISDKTLDMLAEPGDNKPTKMYMIGDEVYRIKNCWFIIRLASSMGLLTHDILKKVNEHLTLADVDNILKGINGFFSHYAMALKGYDDAFTALLCPKNSPKEKEIKEWYCYPIINAEVDPNQEMEMEE